jgi:DNA polymerase-3 subunit gamma/tau
VLSFSGEEVRDEDISALLGLIDRELLLTASRAVAGGDSLALLDLVEKLSEYGADYRNFNRELLLHFREILLVKLAPAGSPLLAQVLPEERERLAPLAEAYSDEDLLRIFDVLTKLETDLRWAQDPRVMLELALLKLVQMRRLMPFAELVSRVERLASGAPAAPRPQPATAPRPPVQRSLDAAPAPQEAATPTAPPATPPPADEAQAILARMLDAVKARPSLAQPLRGAETRLERGVLHLTVAADFAHFAGEHLDEYSQLATQAAGRPVKVQVAGGASPAREEAPSQPELARERLLKEANREPAVQEVLEIFGGRIVDVRESRS